MLAPHSISARPANFVNHTFRPRLTWAHNSKIKIGIFRQVGDCSNAATAISDQSKLPSDPVIWGSQREDVLLLSNKMFLQRRGRSPATVEVDQADLDQSQCQRILMAHLKFVFRLTKLGNLILRKPCVKTGISFLLEFSA